MRRDGPSQAKPNPSFQFLRSSELKLEDGFVRVERTKQELVLRNIDGIGS